MKFNPNSLPVNHRSHLTDSALNYRLAEGGRARLLLEHQAPKPLKVKPRRKFIARKKRGKR